MKTARLSSLSALALCAAVQPLQAQTVDEPYFLGTLILESTKRPQQAFSFAGTVSQADADDLQRRSVTSVEELEQVFAGLSFDMRSSRPYTSVALRGQASLDFYNPAVQVYVDGIAQDAGSLAQFLPFGVEQAEVLYGPQGTLYGRGALGGVISINTAKPGEGAPLAFDLSVGSERRSANVQGELQLADGVWADLALGRVIEDDHLKLPNDDDKGGSKSQNARLRLRVAPEGSPWDLLFSAQRTEVSSDEEYFVPEGSFGSREVLPFFSQYDQDITTMGLTANYDLGWGKVTSTTSHQDRELDRTIYGNYTLEAQTTTTQELRLASDGNGALNYVVGLFYSDSDFARDAYGASVEIDTRSTALFGDLTWALNDRLSISPGIRFDWEDSEVTSVGFGASYTADDSWREVSPKLGVSYTINETLQAFGLISTGFQAGGFSRNALASAAVLSYDPQRVTNAEIGLRYASADGTLSGAVSAFATRTDDLQMFVGTPPLQYLQNVGEAETRGLNAELRYRAGDLGVSAAASYVDAKFTDYDNPLAPGVDLTGNRIPHVPKVTARLGVDYSFDLGNERGTLTPRFGLSYQGRTWFDEANTVGQAAYTLADAGLTWSLPSGPELDLYVTNLTDKDYAQYGFDSGGGAFAYTLGRGRQIGLSLRHAF